MDLMEIRRNMMGVIAMTGSGSVYDSMLEIVASVTLAEDSYSITFPCDFAEGEYILISNPPGNYETISERTETEILSMSVIQIRGLSSKTATGSTVTVRKTPSASNGIDWWTASITLGDDDITINPMSGRHKLLAGFTYYFIKVKGM